MRDDLSPFRELFRQELDAMRDAEREWWSTRGSEPLFGLDRSAPCVRLSLTGRVRWYRRLWSWVRGWWV